jgi:UDP-2,4-diacetamido-2,4,6-trideoxy-beta-L-altropyranose hydrolase
MVKIFFRTDFNNKIGFGHFYRCFSIAEMVEKKYLISFVFNKNVTNLDFINSIPYPIISINEEKDFLSYLYPGNIVVVDSYEFNESKQREINKKNVKLIVIDDLNNMIYDCNAIINHGVYFKKNDYKCSTKTKFYLGLDYLMVRKEFREKSINQVNIKVKNNFEKVFICLGGSDQTGLINNIINFLVKEGVNYFSILTNPDYENQVIKNISNKVIVKTYSNLTPSNIIKILEKSDFAVLPASTILLEAFTVGLPIISGWFIENQKYSLDKFEKMGLIINLNNFNNDLSLKITYAYSLLGQNKNIINNQKKYINLKVENYLNIFNEVFLDDC